MVSVSYQVLFKTNLNIRSFLTEFILSVFENNLIGYDEDNLDSYIKIRSISEIYRGRYLVSFDIDYPDIEIQKDESSSSFDQKKKEFENSLRKMFDDFNEGLSNSEEVESLLKFRDDLLLNSLKEFQLELFELEMKLRSIISHIFIVTYHENLYKFTEYQSIHPIIKGVEEKREELLRSRYENEFFFLTFNQYRNITLPDIISTEILNKIINDSSSNEILKEKLTALGIFKSTKKEYSDFLAEINQDLESIETLRNCVAHNRNPNDKEISNYEKARDNLNLKMNEFLKKLKKESIKYSFLFVQISTEIRESTQMVEVESITLSDEDGNEEDFDDFNLDQEFGFVEENWEEIAGDIKNSVKKSLKEKGYKFIDNYDFEIHDPWGEVH